MRSPDPWHSEDAETMFFRLWPAEPRVGRERQQPAGAGSPDKSMDSPTSLKDGISQQDIDDCFRWRRGDSD